MAQAVSRTLHQQLFDQPTVCLLPSQQQYESFHQPQIQYLLEELKNAESSGKDPIPTMKKIEDLQAQKNNLSHVHEVDE